MGTLEAIAPEGERRRFAVHSPVDGREVARFTVDGAAEVQAKVARAREVQAEWAKTPIAERVRLTRAALALLLQRQEDYSRRLIDETGRTELDTLMIEMFAACDTLNFYAGRAAKSLADRRVGLHLLRHKKARIVYRPLGVIGVISPWNGPFILSMNPTIQAVLAGNAVVIKPSEVTPTAGLLVAELYADAGFPEDLVQVALGDGETGAALVESEVDKISFTGSVRTGRKVGETCGRLLKPCTLELGGKDSMIVCADADLDRAAGGAVFGGLMNAGQFCSGTERIYVVESVAEAFIAKVVAKVGELQLGRDLGPFIFEPQAAIVESQVTEAIELGARALVGGQREGAYFQPTVLVDVTHQMSVMTDETFGPVLPIQVVPDELAAIRQANDSRYGLGASVWTTDTTRGEAIARQLRVGSVTVNETAIVYGALDLPFGGLRDSGVGTVNGADGLRNYSQALPILTDRLGLKEEQVWYPYTPDKARSLKKALKAIWGTPLRWLL